MTHILTMMRAGQLANVEIASIAATELGVEHLTRMADALPPKLQFAQEANRISVFASGWNDVDWSQRIATLRRLLAIFCAMPPGTATLTWLFSGRILEHRCAADLMARWDAAQAPPVIDLIGFSAHQETGARRIMSLGLAAIVGHEIEALVEGTVPELARMVGRLAQLALETGPLVTANAIGPDGQPYRLERHDRTPARAAMIRIIMICKSKMDSSPLA
ncbi:hypothetical protein [Sphingomonas sp.]|uniref:hypothetical protein n=1 Tax=Sphingomonas sp. TaxID=28214 RepID=UPI0025E74393|nr:hypothetical protein [Sphingomonas sp.]